MTSPQAPEWMRGIRRRLDYGWRYRGRRTGILADNSLLLDHADLEVRQLLVKRGSSAFPAACFQCGTCTSICPYGLIAAEMNALSPRHMVRQTQLGYPPVETAQTWLCATCRACEDQCPRGVKLVDFMKALRGIEIDFGLDTVPSSLQRALRNIASVGNPFGEPRQRRADWANRIGVKLFAKGMDILFFPGCFAAYDARARKVAVAVVNLLREAGVDFGILGEDESCCGESARKAGAEDLFKDLARHNISLLLDRGVTRILTTSPHCYHTFKTEYPSFGDSFEVLHHTEYLAQLIRDGRLKPAGRLDAVVTYHDPCYLGRYHGIYDQPRQVLSSIPGVNLVEMDRSRSRSVCCGGGGGRIWQESQKAQRLSDLRLHQAEQTEAQILAVSCPYCLTNFDSGDSSNAKALVPEAKDIAELLWQAF
jgi:Fe-S oxidoreductase